MAQPTRYLCKFGAGPPVQVEFSDWWDGPPIDERWFGPFGFLWSCRRVLLPGLLLTSLFSFSVATLGCGGVVFIGLPLLIYLALRGGFEYRAARPEVAGLIDLPSDLDQYPVYLALESCGTVYGVDEGIASVTGEWLHFHGLHTSFSLKRDLVQVVPPRTRRTRSTSDLVVEYWIEAIRFRAAFYPCDEIDCHGPSKARKVPGFRGLIAEWLAGPTSPAEFMDLPPIVPQPDFVKRTRQAVNVLYLGFLPSMVLALAMLSYNSDSIAIVFVVYTSLVALVIAFANWRLRGFGVLARRARARLSEQELPIEERRVWPDSALPPLSR